MKSYEEGKQVYWSIREKERKQYVRPVPRETIEFYATAYRKGFNRGYEKGLKERL